jgi:pyruvate dehydrogenase E2 component (dihydrolipoamide acetyltransferase)
MPRPFVLPDLGEGLSEAEIVKVLVREGETIAEDAPLLEVETDKAHVEIPSPMGGRVERVHVRPGQTVHVGEVLVTFADAGGAGAPGETTASDGARSTAGEVAEAREMLDIGRETTTPTGRAAAAAPPSSGDAERGTPGKAEPARPAATGGEPARPVHTGPAPATPATRRLARELGVDLRMVPGSGPGGRVTDDDVRAGARAPKRGADAQPPPREAAPAEPGARERAEALRRAGEEMPPGAARPLASGGLEPPPLPRFEQWGPVEREPLSHLRRTIAERMALSATIVPHVTHFDRIDITVLDAIIRANEGRAREQGAPLTLTSFILKAVALALRRHPVFNASLDAPRGEMVLKRYCHLGVAVATERGLIVPVIRDVDRKPILELARELAALARRVREGRATLDDLRGGTFTVTNIGALGGTGAIPIINYPEVAILGVARGRQEPVVQDGQVVPRLMLPITLTFDHRVADGADGARFAAEVVRLLEHPDQLLLEL